MSEPLVIVPAKPWWRKGELWLALLVAALWLFQAAVDLAPSYGLTVPAGIGFAGALAGLAATAMKFVVGLASPTTISGSRWLDRATNDARFVDRSR